MTGEPSVGIVTRPSDDDSYAEPIYRFTTVLEPSAADLTVFTGPAIIEGAPSDDTRYIDVTDGFYTGSGICDLIFLQLIVSLQLVRHREDFDLVYFHKGAMGFLLPVVAARLCNIRTCVIKVGAFFDEREIPGTTQLVVRTMTLVQKLAFRLAHAAVVFSENERSTVPNSTVFVGYSNYRNFAEYSERTPPSERAVDVGFVNRFADLKRVVPLSHAVARLLKDDPEIRARFVGDGPQFSPVQAVTTGEPRFELMGWVDRDELAGQYSDMRVLVVSSKAEGLPTNVIEAMGCGTIVLATPVGSIPDLITDGETGFLIEDTSEAGIREAIEAVLARDDLDRISENARRHVVETYSLSERQRRFAEIIAALVGGA